MQEGTKEAKELTPLLEAIVQKKDELAYQQWLYYKKRGELQGFVDSDGYPTLPLLMMIQTMPWTRIAETFQIMRKYWWNPDMLFRQDIVREETTGELKRMYYLSTGGWSGNESMFAELQRNPDVWNMTWHSSQVGGHHAFQLKGWLLNGQSSEITS